MPFKNSTSNKYKQILVKKLNSIKESQHSTVSISRRCSINNPSVSKSMQSIESREVDERILSIINEKDWSSLFLFLDQQRSELDLFNILDPDGNNLLQLAASKNSDKILIMLCNYVLQV